MMRRYNTPIGWAAIAAATGLLFLLDHLRMINFHFNWFVAILLAVSAALVAFVAKLAHETGSASRPSDIEKPAETGAPDGKT